MKDWALHLAAGEDLIKDFVNIDRIDYRRLMSVYIANLRARNLICLCWKSDEPEIWNAMRNGLFSVQIMNRSISEQINKLIKVYDGLTGILSNDNARARWMLIVPVVLKFIDDMEGFPYAAPDRTIRHHQLTKAFAKKQHELVKKIVSQLEANEELFSEPSIVLCIISLRHLKYRKIIERISLPVSLLVKQSNQNS